MHKILTAAIATSLLAAGAAQAGTATATFTVTATVLSTCSASATGMTFPNYTPGAGAVTANSTISVKCTQSTPYTVALSYGATGSSATRLLTTTGTPAGQGLDYNLFTTNSYLTVWGGLTTQPGTGAGLATANNLTVYGQLLDNANNQSFAPGTYTDTITVTVAY